MKLGLIISNDWELFGDGSGEYFAIQHRPLEELLKVIEAHGAKLTVMAEVGQQWAHQRIAEREEWAQNIVKAWEAILRETIKRKHDVQLHLHPQWLNANYKDNRWNVNLDNWAVSRLSSEVMANVFREGKLYLDNILKPVDPLYECIAFRAGAYCIEPSDIVIQNLLKAGIICDTSVVKGKQNPPFFDYRDAHSNSIPWFTSASDVKYSNNRSNGLLEIPIYSFKSINFPILRKIISHLPLKFDSFSTTKKWFIERNREIIQRYPIHKRPFQENFFHSKSLSDKVKLLPYKVCSIRAISLDYDNLPPDDFIKGIKKIYNSKKLYNIKEKDIIIPIMSTGHVKLVHNYENMKRILNRLDVTFKENIVYWTLHDAIRYWLNEVVTSTGEDFQGVLADTVVEKPGGM